MKTYYVIYGQPLRSCSLLDDDDDDAHDDEADENDYDLEDTLVNLLQAAVFVLDHDDDYYNNDSEDNNDDI